MTSNELNQTAVGLLDAIWLSISEFQGLRLQADDDTWDAASEGSRWLDKLCDIEYILES